MDFSTISTTIALQSSTALEPGNGTYQAGISVTSTGAIIGQGGAVAVSFSSSYVTSGALNNDGLVQGSANYAAVTGDVGVSLTNTGSIAGGAGANYVISLGGNAYIENRGQIAGAEFGAIAFNGGGTLVNSGTVNGPATFRNGAATVVNSGVIAHGNQAIYAASYSTVSNSGQLSGEFFGVELGGGGIITNAGLIAGGNAAIYSRYQTTLVVDPGAQFQGALSFSGAVVLGGTRGQTGSFALDHAAYGLQGAVTQVSFGTGTKWTLEESLQQATGQSITGFGAGDTLVLDGFAVSSTSYQQGQGLVLSNGTQSYTLNLPESTAFVAENGNSTLVGLYTTITGTLTNSVAPGLSAYNAGLTIANTGAVITEGVALNVPANDTHVTISVYNYGLLKTTGTGGVAVDLALGAGLTNEQGGSIAGGVVLTGGASMGNYGVVTAPGAAVRLDAGTSFDNGSYGTLQGGGEGVVFATGGYLRNAGSISGGAGVGVNLVGGTASILNTGVIAGGAFAVSAAAGTTLSLTEFSHGALSGAVAGGGAGQLTLVSEYGEDGTLDMGGSFSGFDSVSLAGVSGWTLAGTAAELAGGQAISGFGFNDTLVLEGVNAASYTTLGTELVLGGETIDLTGSLPNGFILTASGGNTTIAAQLISIVSTATTIAVTPGQNGFARDMTITATGSVTPAEGAGVNASAEGAVTIVNEGLITAGAGEAPGVAAGSDGLTLVNAAGGTISGFTGVNLYNDGLIKNFGLIEGETVVQTIANATPLVDTIGNAGVGVIMNGGTLANGGTIAGGVLMETFNDTTITNVGLINGAGTGVEARGNLSLSNTGDITGMDIGVSAGRFGVITNAGTISGANYAVQASYDLDLTVDQGAVFLGLVEAGSNGTLNLAGQGGSFSLANFDGFSTINLAAESGWTLEGGTAALASGEVLNGFGPGDTLVIDGLSLVAGDVTWQGGVAGLALLDTLSNEAGMTGFGSLSALDSLVATSDGVNTTIAAVAMPAGTISLVSSLYTSGVTLGTGGFAAAVSVTGTGSIVTGSDSVAIYADYVPGASIGNAGLIGSSIASDGAVLRGAVSLSNSGVVIGQTGVAAYGTAAITNSGTIEGAGLAEVMPKLVSFAGLPGGKTFFPVGTGVELAAGRVSNSGTISGLNTGVWAAAGAIDNQAGGTIAGVNYGVEIGNGTISNASAIYGGRDGVRIGAGKMLAAGTVAISNALAGTIAAGNGGYGIGGGGDVSISNAGLILDGIAVSGTVAINNAAGGTISAGTGSYAIGGEGDFNIANAGTILGDIDVYGSLSLRVEGGAVFKGNVYDHSNDGVLILDGAGSLDISDPFTGFNTFSFTSSDFTLQGDVSQIAAGQTIVGFGAGDNIVVNGFTAASTSIVSGAGIVLTDAGGAQVTLNVAGNLAGLTTTTNAAGTQIVAPCFVAGTRITTARGRRPVEQLRIGEMVATLGGAMMRIKWIGTRAYDGRFAARNHLTRPVRIAAGAIADGVPVRDLYVSPDHAICLDGHLIHAWRLVNGVSITQPEPPERVEYFHIELERHAVIFAEDCPAESFLDEDCRNRFQNAAEFGELYPKAMVPGEPCLPRLSDGFGLHAAWKRLAERAGVAAGLACGTLRGCVDEAGGGVVRGWAQDESEPEAPVVLLVLAGGEVIGRVLANGYRPDLRAAGLGSGCHGFSMALPAGERRAIEVRRALDGAVVASGGRLAA
jgi:hypothetical protein